MTESTAIADTTATSRRSDPDEDITLGTLDEEVEDEEDFNPLGKIEGWSAFECASGPFGYRG